MYTLDEKVEEEENESDVQTQGHPYEEIQNI